MIDLHEQTLEGLIRHQEDRSPVALWQAAGGVGYSTATVPIDLGGGGGSVEDGAAIARAGARVLFEAPLAIANLVLGPLLSAAGWPAGEDLPAVVVEREGPEGRSSAVDFGTVAQAAYVVTALGSGSRLRLLDLGSEGLVRRPARRADPAHVAHLELAGAEVLDEVVLEAPFEHWLALGALSSAVEIAGAVDAVLQRTLVYLDARVQFGRRLIEFQALQHRVAELAARAQLLGHAVDEAVERWSELDDGSVQATAVAKIEASEVGLHAVAEAHQLHGAIGYTDESGLGEYSKLVWSQSRRHGPGPWWRLWLGDRVRSADLWNSSAPLGTEPRAAADGALPC